MPPEPLIAHLCYECYQNMRSMSRPSEGDFGEHAWAHRIVPLHADSKNCSDTNQGQHRLAPQIYSGVQLPVFRADQTDLQEDLP